MVKKKNNDIDETNADIESIFSGINKINPYYSTLTENSLCNVENWIDTGCMSLNYLCSGNYKQGIPFGRSVLLYGESQTGKTLIMGKVMANAQKIGMCPIYFDSENALTKEFALKIGLNPDLVKYFPIDTVENLTIQVNTLLDNIENSPRLHGKYLFCIDSLSNNTSKKELEDIKSGKVPQDMGLQAKLNRAFLRSITMKLARTKTPLMLTTHIIDNPNEYMPSSIKKTKGGNALHFIASISLQLSAKKQKNEEDGKEAINFYTGQWINMYTIKNRFMAAFLKADNFLDYSSGLDKYSGVFNMALKLDVLKAEGRSYIITKTNENLGQKASWMCNDKIWEEKILPEMDLVMKNRFKTKSELVNMEDIPDNEDSGEIEIVDDELLINNSI